MSKLRMADYITNSLSCSLLPGDLMVEILCRSPVKSLTRFKTVNKSWYFVIKNRLFMRMHYDHVSKLEDESFILLRSNSIESELGLIRPGSTQWEPLGVKEPGEYEIVGSAKGWICLTKLDVLLGSYFVVCNPALAQSKFIYYKTTSASTSIHQGLAAYFSIGFGYDDFGDDFKIVKLEFPGGASAAASRLLRVHIYSFRTNSWKISEGLTGITMSSKFNLATLGSCIYWPATTNAGHHCRLAEFNLSTETLNISSPLPGHWIDIVTLRQESLAFMFEGNDNAGVWTMSMQSYDFVKQVDSNWLTMHPHSAENYLCTLRTLYGKVASSRRDGDFVVRTKRTLKLFSRKENKLLSTEKFSKSRHILQVWCYRESLFPLS